MVTRTVDKKGRLNLGQQFAGQMVIVTEDAEGTLTIQRAAVVPQREAWLHQNRKALAAVQRGLEQATEGQFSDGPDLKAGRELADALED